MLDWLHSEQPTRITISFDEMVAENAKVTDTRGESHQSSRRACLVCQPRSLGSNWRSGKATPAHCGSRNPRAILEGLKHLNGLPDFN